MYDQPRPTDRDGPEVLRTPGRAPDAPALPRVLVVDDSAAQRKMLVTLLRRWGFEAVACADADQALLAARDSSIGLIVSDWMMPGMTGPEFCRRLRASDRDAYQYVILLTSKSDTSDLSEGLSAGADDFPDFVRVDFHGGNLGCER